MVKYKLSNEEKDIVGIGKMMIDTRTVTWNVPHLHFLVSRDISHYEAVCLEFGLISTGHTQEEVSERLIELVIFHIGAVMDNGGGFDELKETALNEFMNEYWGIYRHIEFCLAETKRDLSHEVENRITKAIQELFDKRVKELIYSMAKKTAEEAIKEYERISIFKVNSITYSSLEAAA